MVDIMKKPDITPGEWNIKQHGDWCDVVSDHDFLDCGDIVCQDLLKPDAQAIKEVSNLLDDLIEIIRIYESAPDTSTLDTDLNPAIQKARQTLKKAGCT